ncbi:MAG: hypothetical protein MJD61_09170 [Proteobacteria bacterium]|nr:hypothetical protein [Pseudomonadota bacterium]
MGRGAGGRAWVDGGMPMSICPELPLVDRLKRFCSRAGDGTQDTWARCAGGLADDTGNAVALDVMGSVYVGAGMGARFPSDTAAALQCWHMSADDFATVRFETTSLLSPADGGPALAKYDRDGRLLWAKFLPGTGSQGKLQAIALDSLDGSMVAAGNSLSTSRFQPSAPRNLYITRLDHQGNPVWFQSAIVMPKVDGYSRADVSGVAIHPMTNHIVVTGQFHGELTFGAGSSSEQVLAAHRRGDLFIAEFDQLGNLIWAGDAGGSASASMGREVLFKPDGSAILVGALSGAADKAIEDRLGTEVEVIPFGVADMVLVHYDQDGHVLWANHAGFPRETVHGEGVAYDASGNIYVTGTFSTCALFPRAPGNPVLLCLACPQVL